VPLCAGLEANGEALVMQILSVEWVLSLEPQVFLDSLVLPQSTPASGLPSPVASPEEASIFMVLKRCDGFKGVEGHLLRLLGQVKNIVGPALRGDDAKKVEATGLEYVKSDEERSMSTE